MLFASNVLTGGMLARLTGSLRALNGIDGLLTPGDGGSCPGGSFVTLQSDKGPITLALPNPATSEMVLSLPEGRAPAQRIDLRTGIITPLETNAATLVLAFPGGDAIPTLIVPGYLWVSNY